MIPVFLNVRDRVTDLKRLVEWFESVGCEDITLLDNASTYPPLVEYLESCPHHVVFLGDNLGSRALWLADLVPDVSYIYSDPDVLPVEECPPDVFEHLAAAMKQHGYAKGGLGIKIDDVPELDPMSRRAEGEWWAPWRLLHGNVYRSLVDTTMALYQGGSPFTYEAIRTGAPYVLRHLPWYRSMDDLDEEHRYYLEHASVSDYHSRWARQYQMRSIPS